MNSPISFNVAAKVSVALLGGSVASPTPIPGAAIAPFSFTPGTSPLTLNFSPLSLTQTIVGVQFSVALSGGSGWSSPTPVVFIVPFPAPEVWPANRAYTLVYTAPLLGAATLAGTVGPDTLPPSAPTGLTAAADAVSPMTNLDLSWGAAKDDTAVTAYLVERCQGLGCATFAQIASVIANPSSFADGGLSSGTSYSYRVRASDAAGNIGPYSNVASALTASPAPSVPPAPPAGAQPSKVGSSICTGTGTHSIPCTSPALTQIVAPDGAVWTMQGSIAFRAAPGQQPVDTRQPYPDANVLYVFQNVPGSAIEISVFSNAHGHVCYAPTTGKWGGC